jgi:hypothetical protein
MLLRYLDTGCRRLGVSFIAPRGLGAVDFFIRKSKKFPVCGRTMPVRSTRTGSCSPQFGILIGYLKRLHLKSLVMAYGVLEM